MTQSGGWRLLVRTGPACLAAVLVLLLIVVPFRDALRPRVRNPVITQTQGTLTPQGPPMQIDPEDLARAGQERNNNGVGLRFC